MDTRDTAPKQPIDQGLLARLTTGVRYVLSGIPPNSWFGPGQPLQPMPPQPGETRGRQFDYQVGYNQQTRPRQDELTSFEALRALSVNYDLMRAVIETLKDQLCSLPWKIKYKDPKKPQDDDCLKIQEFLWNPDKENTWDEWLRMLLEDMLVLDAVAIYPRLTKGGKPYALELVDGATIRRVLAYDGRTPSPPDPAYQQIIKGVIAGDFSRDELFYFRRNPRTNKAYGYSPVEQIINTVNTGIRRQLAQQAYFTEGTVPDALAAVPKEWSAEDIKQYQQYWDALLSGEVEKRRKVKFIPDAINFLQTRQPPLKDEFDEWLARVVCYTFGVSYQPFVKDNNRSTAEVSAKSSASEGLGPRKQWVKGKMDFILVRFFGRQDLEFDWQEEPELMPMIQAQIDQIYVQSGIMLADEVRERLGMQPLPPAQLPMSVQLQPMAQSVVGEQVAEGKKPTEAGLSDTTEAGSVHDGQNRTMKPEA